MWRLPAAESRCIGRGWSVLSLRPHGRISDEHWTRRTGEVGYHAVAERADLVENDRDVPTRSPMRRAISSFLWMAVILAIVFPPVALPGATVERRLTPEEIIKRWKDGPVRYLMTGQEEEVLHSLKT